MTVGLALAWGCGSADEPSGGAAASTSTSSAGGATGSGGAPTGGGGGGLASASVTAGSGGAGGAPVKDPNAFVHPGVQVDQGQLDFVKAKLASGAEPWTTALADLKKSPFAALDYQAKPRATVECGPTSMPDFGCTEEKSDVIAAYTHALLWYLTGNEANAKKSIEIMNAWSAVLVEHTNSNAPLQAAWAASEFPRAAEIIRYTYNGWSPSDVTAFGKMLSTAYMPLIDHGSASNGNWELSMIEASMGIAVFLDDHAAFKVSVDQWRKRVPAYVYLTTDGATPVPPPTGSKTGAALVKFWYDQPTYVDGLCQETCRDLGHVQYGLAAMTNAAETATIQGINLFAEESKRLRLGYEFHAQLLNGAAVPKTLCGGKLTAVSSDPMWEIGYNALVDRAGLDLPETKALLPKIRPTGATHHMAWETLTHAGIGNAGL
ncbi:MAG: alginate lyase family protein [Byssovorax sp.]